MTIRQLEVIFYSRVKQPWWSEKSNDPNLERVLSELETMDRYEKPMLMLYQNPDETEADSLRVTGGNGIFHVQISEPDFFWYRAFDPYGSEEEVEVWTSDQGFETEKKYTFGLNEMKDIVSHYFKTGQKTEAVSWRKC